MKNTPYILLLLILCFSCTSRTIYKKPKNLITKEQMVDVWVDIIIANSAKNVKNIKENRKINYMPFLYEKYAIDSTRFMENNIYYTSKIEEYEKMFEEVDVRLKKIKEIYDPFSKDIDPTLPDYKRDSIRRENRLKKSKPKRVKELIDRDELKELDKKK